MFLLFFIFSVVKERTVTCKMTSWHRNLDWSIYIGLHKHSVSSIDVVVKMKRVTLLRSGGDPCILERHSNSCLYVGESARKDVVGFLLLVF